MLQSSTRMDCRAEESVMGWGRSPSGDIRCCGRMSLQSILKGNPVTKTHHVCIELWEKSCTAGEYDIMPRRYCILCTNQIRKREEVFREGD